MNRIILDSHLAQQITLLREPTELCDASGRVLATAIPVADILDCEPVSPEVDDEELDRRAASGAKRLTTRELLDHLRQL